VGSLRTFDPDGPALPDIPPISTRELAVGLVDLLSKADGLALPRYATIHETTQAFGLQFAPAAASLRALVSWAQRFGAVLVSKDDTDQHGQPCTYARIAFDYFGVDVTAYAFVPVTETGTPDEQPAHADYPHEPGRLYGCPACEAACHCTPGDAECVYSGPHNGLAAT
jgi:hypothetical protein